MRKKIVFVVGARPQFLKYYPLQQEAEKWQQLFLPILVHTGQHYDFEMSEIFFQELKIKNPTYHLSCRFNKQGQQTAVMLKKLEEVMLIEQPEAVVIFGDTNSTLAAALAAAKLRIPIVHVESGLRSYNKTMPEEINRLLADHCSTILCCPTARAVINLQKEGFTNIIYNGKLLPFSQIQSISALAGLKPLVVNTGDIMYDLIKKTEPLIEKKSFILNLFNLVPKNYCLLTIHRAENTNQPEKIKELFSFVSSAADSKKVIFLCHPRTKKFLSINKIKIPEKIVMQKPVSYFEMLLLLKNCSLLFTDSGGLQKEAFWLKVPCITLRTETEWTETVDSGWNILYKNYSPQYKFPSEKQSFAFGDGKTALRIFKILEKFFSYEKK